MKNDTVAVVVPSMCSGRSIGSGRRAPDAESATPAAIDSTSGLRASREPTTLAPARNPGDSSRAYSSSAIVTATAASEVEAAASAASRSASGPGKAKITNGIPKKARLPKTVLTASSTNVPRANPNTRESTARTTAAPSTGRTPASTKRTLPRSRFISEMLATKSAGSANQ